MTFYPISTGSKDFFHSAPTHLMTTLVGESNLAHTHFTILNYHLIALTNYCSQLSILVNNLQITVNNYIK